MWVPVHGFVNFYEVSNFGRIKSMSRKIFYTNKIGVKFYYLSKEKFLKPYQCEGYLKVDLYRDNIRIKKFCHRLVAIHFIPNSKNKPEVNHIDGNRSNPHHLNLEWCTTSENNLHSFNTLNRKATSLSGKNNTSSIPILVIKDCAITEYESLSIASNELSISRFRITSACGNSNEINGSIFKFL